MVRIFIARTVAMVKMKGRLILKFIKAFSDLPRKSETFRRHFPNFPEILNLRPIFTKTVDSHEKASKIIVNLRCPIEEFLVLKANKV